MRYLGLALYAEGPTDYYFLKPLLRRLCEELCARRGEGVLEIGDLLELDDPADRREESREERITAAALAAKSAWHVLFIHADGAGHPDRSREEQIAPAMRRLGPELGAGYDSVAVIPIRETEAWLLADGNALRQAFGTNRTNDELGIPSIPGEVERIADPKQILNAACMAATSRRRGRLKKASAYFEIVGECVCLAELSKVPAFKAMYDELSIALHRLGFIR
jgi:uncharacterized protein DUF4276